MPDVSAALLYAVIGYNSPFLDAQDIATTSAPAQRAWRSKLAAYASQPRGEYLEAVCARYASFW